VVEVKVRHHHEADRLGVDAAGAQLRGQVLAGLELRLGEVGDQPAEVLGGSRRNRGMQARVDEERAGGGMVDEEGGNRQRQPLRARGAEAEHPHGRELSVALDEPAGRVHPPAEQWFDRYGRPLEPARERRGEPPGVRPDLHRRRTVAR
jgi:hypothetical protein